MPSFLVSREIQRTVSPSYKVRLPTPTFKSRLTAGVVTCQRYATSGDLPDIVTFSKDVCIAILQNSGIRSFFYTVVRYSRMPPMDAETIGGISTGRSSYSGLVCVPPYSQNAGDASTYATAWRLLAYHVSQLLYGYHCCLQEGEVLLIDYEVIVESCHLELESGIL